MLYTEFTSRTGVEVDAAEYAAIEEIYTRCDLDKDEFCKLWSKANKSRVNAAKEAAKAAKRKAEINEVLYNLTDRRIAWDDLNGCNHEVFTKKELKALCEAGITLEYERYNEVFNRWTRVPKIVCKIIREVEYYLNIA